MTLTYSLTRYRFEIALLETAVLREAIAASRRDSGPAIPAEQMFAEMDAVIDQVVTEQATA